MVMLYLSPTDYIQLSQHFQKHLITYAYPIQDWDIFRYSKWEKHVHRYRYYWTWKM